MSSSVFTPVVYPQVGDESPGRASERARGYADGYAEGLRRAAATLEAADAERARRLQDALARNEDRTQLAVQALGSAVSALNARTAPAVDEADAALVAGCLDLAETVLGREVSGGRSGAEDALRRALAGIPDDQPVRVLLNPLDVDALGEQAGAVLPPNATIEKDPGLARGDAIVRFADGWLDARCVSAVARIREILTEERG